MFFQNGGGFSTNQQHHQNIASNGNNNVIGGGQSQHGIITRTNGGNFGGMSNGGGGLGIRTITPDIQNDHNISGVVGGGVNNNMSYSFHGSGSVVLGGGLQPGPGSGLGSSGLVATNPPEGYVSANVFSVSKNILKSKHVLRVKISCKNRFIFAF